MSKPCNRSRDSWVTRLVQVFLLLDDPATQKLTVSDVILRDSPGVLQTGEGNAVDPAQCGSGAPC